MAHENKFMIELEGLSVDEFDELSVTLNQHADNVDGAHRGHLTAEALTMAGAALTFVWANRQNITEALKLADALVTWVQKVLKLRQNAAPAAPAPRIVLVSPDQVKLNLLQATPEEVQQYFSQRSKGR